MQNEEIQQFFGPQRRQHVWGPNDGDWGKAMMEHYQENVAGVLQQQQHTTSNIPRILHFIWLGPRPMPNEDLLQSWRQNHPNWEIQVWRNDNLSFEMQNQEAFQYALQHQRYGMASDILRCEVLYKYGGVYVDVDYLCVAPLTFENLEFYCGASNVGCVEVNNGLLAAKPHSPIVKLAMDDVHAWFQQHGRPLALVSSFMGGTDVAAAASLLSDIDICRHTGPGLWTRVLGPLFLQEHVPETLMVFPYTAFHPMPNTDRHVELTQEQIVERYVVPNETKAIHLWHCSWQRNTNSDIFIE